MQDFNNTQHQHEQDFLFLKPMEENFSSVDSFTFQLNLRKKNVNIYPSHFQKTAPVGQFPSFIFFKRVDIFTSYIASRRKYTFLGRTLKTQFAMFGLVDKGKSSLLYQTSVGWNDRELS